MIYNDFFVFICNCYICCGFICEVYFHAVCIVLGFVTFLFNSFHCCCKLCIGGNCTSRIHFVFQFVKCNNIYILGNLYLQIFGYIEYRCFQFAVCKGCDFYKLEFRNALCCGDYIKCKCKESVCIG